MHLCAMPWIFFSTHIKLECHKFSETKGKEFDIFFLFVRKQKYAKVRRADQSQCAVEFIDLKKILRDLSIS